MRDDKDIREILFTLRGKFQIDMERVEEDPNWVFFASKVASGAMTNDEALNHYLVRYLTMEDYPKKLPVTNGPADFFSIGVEVKDASSGSSGRSEQVS